MQEQLRKLRKEALLAKQSLEKQKDQISIDKAKLELELRHEKRRATSYEERNELLKKEKVKKEQELSTATKEVKELEMALELALVHGSKFEISKNFLNFKVHRYFLGHIYFIFLIVLLLFFIFFVFFCSFFLLYSPLFSIIFFIYFFCISL